MTRKKLMTKVSLICLSAIGLAGCEWLSPHICDDYCGSDARTEPVYTLVTEARDANGNSQKVPYSRLFVKTGSGDELQTPMAGKQMSLDPDCFSTVDYNPIHLKDLELRWHSEPEKRNFTVTFINFGKDGRLESRNLSDLSQASEVQAKIKGALSSTSSSPQSDYVVVSDLLSNLQGDILTGRPDFDQIGPQGFKPNDLSSIPPEKTPFYKDLGVQTLKNSTGHVFFYVLLDREVQFQREYAATIPITAQSPLVQLYSPFFQYEITPLEHDAEKLDVLPFHFVRGGNMATHGHDETKDFTEKEECIYPYNIGIKMRSQKPNKPQTPDQEYGIWTPVEIDPDIKVRGPVTP